MNLSQEQLEWIVSEVVRRLQSSAANVADTNLSATPVTAELSLKDRLVTTETLRDKLEGITQVDTIPGAVVTPAVVDLLRERRIKLVRATSKRGA